MLSANEDEEGRLVFGSLHRIHDRIFRDPFDGAVDFSRCGPPPPLFQHLSLLLSAYVCPESLSACRLAIPCRLLQVLIPMVGLLHRQFWSGGGRGGQGDDLSNYRFDGWH